MSSLFSKSILFLGIVLISGCHVLGTEKSICQDQTMVNLPNVRTIGKFDLIIGKEVLVDDDFAHVTQDETGRYSLYTINNSKPFTHLEVCQIGNKLVGSLFYQRRGTKFGVYLIYNIEITSNEITWRQQTADLSALDDVGIHYMSEAHVDPVFNRTVTTIQVSPASSNQAAALVEALQEEANGSRLVFKYME